MIRPTTCKARIVGGVKRESIDLLSGDDEEKINVQNLLRETALAQGDADLKYKVRVRRVREHNAN